MKTPDRMKSPELGRVVDPPLAALARVEASVEALAAGTEKLRRDVHDAIADCQRKVSSAIRRAAMRLRFAAAEAEANGVAVELDSDLVQTFVDECIAEHDQAETEKPAEPPASE